MQCVDIVSKSQIIPATEMRLLRILLWLLLRHVALQYHHILRESMKSMKVDTSCGIALICQPCVASKRGTEAQEMLFIDVISQQNMSLKLDLKTARYRKFCL